MKSFTLFFSRFYSIFSLTRPWFGYICVNSYSWKSSLDAVPLPPDCDWSRNKSTKNILGSESSQTLLTKFTEKTSFVLLAQKVKCNLPPWHPSEHTHTQLCEYSTKVLAGNYSPYAATCGDRLNQTVSHRAK